MRLRFFNQAGVAAFARQLDLCGSPEDLGSVSALLEDDALTEVVQPAKEIKVEEFSDRMECARFFSKLFRDVGPRSGSKGIEPFGNRGLWSWLSAAWFSMVARNAKGEFYVGAHERYILAPMALKHYRHLLYGPWSLYELYEGSIRRIELVSFMLAERVTAPSNFYEQVASRREIIMNHIAMDVVNSLYVDPETGRTRKGALSAKTKGCLRRFGTVYNQLDVNFDMQSMDVELVLKLLPNEFDSWTRAARRQLRRRRSTRD